MALAIAGAIGRMAPSTHTACTTRPRSVAVFDQDCVQNFWNVFDGRNTIVDGGRVDRLPIFKDQLFEQRVTEALNGRTFILAFRRDAIDNSADISRRAILSERDVTGIFVHHDLRNAAAVSRKAVPLQKLHFEIEA